MNLVPFTYADQPVRVVELDGEPWFVASDITPILGYQHGPSAIRRLDADEHRSVPFALVDSTVRPGFGPQSITVVSESGAYSLILWSQKEEAKPFRRWITAEVLPTIRKHGAYMSPAVIEQTLTDPDFIIGLAQRLKDEQARNRILTPKAAAFDLWLSSNADYGIDAAAKALCAGGYMTGRNRLFEQLAELGWAYKAADGWRYTQPHGPEGTKRLAIRMSYYTNSKTGESQGRTTLRITAKGIHDLAAKVGANPALVADALDSEAGAA